MNTDTKQPTITSQYASDKALLIKMLRGILPGESITYRYLSDQLHHDVRQTSALWAARKFLEREERIRFGTIRGRGLRRMTDSEVALSADGCTGRVRRAATREIIRLRAISDEGNLKPDELSHQRAHLSVLQVVRISSGRKSLDRLEAAALSDQSLTLEHTTDILKQSIKKLAGKNQ